MQAPSEGLWHSDVRVAVLVAEHVFAAVVVGVVHVGLVAAFCDGVVGGVQSEGICCLQKAAAEEVTVAFVAFSQCAALLFIVSLQTCMPLLLQQFVAVSMNNVGACVGEGV